MRYAIVTDIHANFAALQAVDADVRKLRQQDMSRPIRYWFLGDLVGYGPHPTDCIRWLKETAQIANRWVPGNHDEYLARPFGKLSQEAEKSLSRHAALLQEPETSELGQWFKREVMAAITPTSGGEETRSKVVEQFDDLTAVFVHGSVSPMGRRDTYVTAWNEGNLLSGEFGMLAEAAGRPEGAIVLFSGHTHYPMWARPGSDGRPSLQSIRYFEPEPLGEGMMIINPGSVGQPRDGDTRAAYLIFDTVEQTVEFRRVLYPIEKTVNDLQADWMHYPESLTLRLETADGRIELQKYQQVYRRPKWDLEAL